MSATTAPTPTPTPTPLQTYMLSLVNDARAAAGVRPLQLDAELIAAAQGHAAWMVDADVFSHTGQGGSTPAQRGTAANYGWVRYAENVAYVSGTGVAPDERIVRQLHTNLMGSPGHRANILGASFSQVGIGLASGDYQGRPAVFVAQNFATPTAAELADGTGIADAAPTPVPAPTPTPTTPPAPSVPLPPPAPPTPDPVRVTVAAGGRTLAVEARWNGAGYDVATVPAG